VIGDDLQPVTAIKHDFATFGPHLAAGKDVVDPPFFAGRRGDVAVLRRKRVPLRSRIASRECVKDLEVARKYRADGRRIRGIVEIAANYDRRHAGPIAIVLDCRNHGRGLRRSLACHVQRKGQVRIGDKDGARSYSQFGNKHLPRHVPWEFRQGNAERSDDRIPAEDREPLLPRSPAT
jgi:hypothetical protein